MNYIDYGYLNFEAMSEVSLFCSRPQPWCLGFAQPQMTFRSACRFSAMPLLGS